MITGPKENIDEKTGSILPENPYFSLLSLASEAGLGSYLPNDKFVSSTSIDDRMPPKSIPVASKIKDWGKEELEVIIEWWKGEILEVHNNFFSCLLIDSKGNESTAEIDLGNVCDDDKYNVKVGATFTYVVSYQDRYEGRRTIDDLAFIAPTVWTKQNEDLFESMYSRLFPKDVTDF